MAGMGRGDGWIVPVSIFIETEQFVPQYCSIFENIGMYPSSTKYLILYLKRFVI